MELDLGFDWEQTRGLSVFPQSLSMAASSRAMAMMPMTVFPGPSCLSVVCLDLPSPRQEPLATGPTEHLECA